MFVVSIALKITSAAETHLAAAVMLTVYWILKVESSLIDPVAVRKITVSGWGDKMGLHWRRWYETAHRHTTNWKG